MAETTTAGATAPVTAADILAAADAASPTGETTARTFTVIREPARHGASGPAYGLRKDDASGTVYVFKRSGSGENVKDRNMCSAIDAARAAAVGII